MVTKQVVDDKAREVAQGDPSVDIVWYDGQFYGVLAMFCTGTALQTVKNQCKNVGLCGSNSWWKLTREVAGKTAVRLERLADLVHDPKVFAYKEGLA